RYFRVTPDDIRRVAEKYLTPEKVVLVINPVPPGQPESEAVQVGPAAPAETRSLPEPKPPQGGPDWSQMPGPSEPRPFHPPQIARRTLSNGMDVWIAEWHTLPIISAQLLVPAGTGDDPPGKSGLARLVATLLDKGTKTKTAVELAEAFELLGTSPNVAVGVDNTTLAFSVVTRNLNPTLDLAAEMLNAPRFDPQDFDRERQLQLAALLQGPDDVTWIARRAFRALLYGPKHPYGNPAEGYPETVKALTLDDVRHFHQTQFGADGSTLIVVGDVEPEALVQTLEASLGTWKAQRSAPVLPRPPAQVKAEPGVAYLVDKPGAKQSVLNIGRRWVDRKDPRYFATLIGNRILGADFLSRLNRNLREEHGFTYGAGSAFVFRRTGSIWLVSTLVRTDATAEALKEALGELDALAGNKPFTTEEISTARIAEARSFPESFEAPAGIAGALRELAEFGLPPDYLETFLDRLQATTPEEVRQAMTEVVAPRERVVLIVGDRKEIEPKLKMLGFQEIRLVTSDGLPVK
ncbi:MAG: insulinase family protein, partial [Isosphaeraceae bacterium]|nr:insulinase family protein [Isosphaeraceae bacterium]